MKNWLALLWSAKPEPQQPPLTSYASAHQRLIVETRPDGTPAVYAYVGTLTPKGVVYA